MPPVHGEFLSRLLQLRASFHSEKRQPRSSDTRLVIQQPRLPTNLNRLRETAIIMARVDNRSASEKVFGASRRSVIYQEDEAGQKTASVWCLGRRPSPHDFAIWVARRHDLSNILRIGSIENSNGTESERFTFGTNLPLSDECLKLEKDITWPSRLRLHFVTNSA